MLHQNDISKSFIEVFNSMKDLAEYKFNSNTFNNLNTVRQKHNYLPVKPFTFKKIGKTLVFDWKENNWDKTVFDIEALDKDPTSFAIAFTLTLAFPFSLAFPFAENQIEESKQVSCEGKIVEIDGKKYRLVET